jgi:hypothetical protein
LATELILDFGQDANDVNYTEAAHIGNIILGRVAVRQADAAKAKEHLLIAVRAPLRREKSLSARSICGLPRNFWKWGEKDTVAEYLKLCERLLNYSELLHRQNPSLKNLAGGNQSGQTPSLNFR